MKKTILAAAIITATSFCASAEMGIPPVGEPTQPIDAPIVIDPIEIGDPLDPITQPIIREPGVDPIEVPGLDPINEFKKKAALKLESVAEDFKNKSGAEQAAAFNKFMEAKNNYANIVVGEDGEPLVLRWLDEDGQVQHKELTNISDGDLNRIYSGLKDKAVENANSRKLAREERRLERQPEGPRVPTNPRNPMMPIEEDDVIGINPGQGDLVGNPIEDTPTPIIDPITREPGVEPIQSGRDKLKQAIIDKSGEQIIVDPIRAIDREKAKEAIAAKKQEVADNLGDVQGERIEIAQQAYSAYDQRQDAQIAALYSLEGQVSSNTDDIAWLKGQVQELDERLDGVMAGTHAVNNARPFLSGTGQTAMGVGVGYAGDAGAIAVGAAHSFTENWSASATLNVTTGTYSEVSGGAGVQYVF